MVSKEIKKAQAQHIEEIVEYITDSVVIKSIINKPTGNISVSAFDAGVVVVGKVFPFDNLVQVIDGHAEIVIDDNSNLLKTGESIIIPAHSRNTTKANVRFKILSTIIKSGYEEVS